MKHSQIILLVPAMLSVWRTEEQEPIWRLIFFYLLHLILKSTKIQHFNSCLCEWVWLTRDQDSQRKKATLPAPSFCHSLLFQAPYLHIKRAYESWKIILNHKKKKLKKKSCLCHGWKNSLPVNARRQHIIRCVWVCRWMSEAELHSQWEACLLLIATGVGNSCKCH